MAFKIDKILGLLRERDETFTFEAAKTNNTTNSYIKSNDVFTNLTPIVLSKDMVIDSISASSDGAETWIAEIHDDGVLIPGASLSLSGESEKTVEGLKISVSKGAKLMFYVNGTTVKRPRIIVTLNK